MKPEQAQGLKEGGSTVCRSAAKGGFSRVQIVSEILHGYGNDKINMTPTWHAEIKLVIENT